MFICYDRNIQLDLHTYFIQVVGNTFRDSWTWNGHLLDPSEYKGFVVVMILRYCGCYSVIVVVILLRYCGCGCCIVVWGVCV